MVPNTGRVVIVL